MNPGRSWGFPLTCLAAAAGGAGAFGCLVRVSARGGAPVGPGSLSLGSVGLWTGMALTLLAWLVGAGLLRWAGEPSPGAALKEAAVALAPLGFLWLALGEDRLALGTILDLVALIGIGGALWRLGRRIRWLARQEGSGAQPWRERLTEIGPGGTAGLVAAAGLVLALLYAGGVLAPRRGLLGDEPSYVTIAHSLAVDGDISMADDYQDQEYRRWVTGRYPMFAHPGRDGRMYPHHGLGLPLYLAPFYRLARSWSDPALVGAIRAAMGIVFALLLAQSYLLAWELTGDRRASLLYVAVLGTTCPLLFYSTEVYPETAAALALVWGLRRIRRLSAAPLREGLAVGAAVAILPWLGTKYIPAAGVLLLLGIWGARRRPGRGWAGLAGAAGLGFGAFFWFLHRLYGVLTPRAIYHGVAHPLPETSALEQLAGIAMHPWAHLGTVGTFLQGALLEQRIGLLIWAPVFWFSLPEAVRLLRRRPSLLAVLAPGLVHLLFYAYTDNWGGFCPPNRPLVTALPLLALPLAWAFRRPGGRLRRWALAGSWGIALVWSVTFLGHHRWLYHTMNPHLIGGAANALAKLSMPFGPDWPRWVPLVMGPEKSGLANGCWTLALVLLVAVDLWLGRRRGPREPGSRLVPLPWVAGPILVGLLAWRCWALPADRNRLDFPGPPAHGLLAWETGLYEPELGGFWMAGDRPVRAWLELPAEPREWLGRTHSLVDNRVELTLGRDHRWLEYGPGTVQELRLRPGGAFRRGPFHYYKLRIRAEEGRIPSATGGTDPRNLGAFFRFP